MPTADIISDLINEVADAIIGIFEFIVGSLS